MAGESTEALLRSLTSAAGETSVEIYLHWAGLTDNGDDTLESAVRRKLVAAGHSANIRENLLSTMLAGGATGESVEDCLLKTGLVGLS
jgi:hypothetical protein